MKQAAAAEAARALIAAGLIEEAAAQEAVEVLVTAELIEEGAAAEARAAVEQAESVIQEARAAQGEAGGAAAGPAPEASRMRRRRPLPRASRPRRRSVAPVRRRAAGDPGRPVLAGGLRRPPSPLPAPAWGLRPFDTAPGGARLRAGEGGASAGNGNVVAAATSRTPTVAGDRPR